jgi:hypothetical protein
LPWASKRTQTARGRSGQDKGQNAAMLAVDRATLGCFISDWTTVDLLRHGEADHNVGGEGAVIGGWADLPLTRLLWHAEQGKVLRFDVNLRAADEGRVPIAS